MGRRAQRSAGFTIMEVMVVVAIVGLLIAASTLALRNVLRSELRSGASRTASALRLAFDRAAMTGMYIRVAFDLDKGEVWLEGSRQGIGLQQGAEQHVVGQGEERAAEEAARRKVEEEDAAGGGGLLSMLGLGGEDALLDPEEAAANLKEDVERDAAPFARPRTRFVALKGMLAGKRIRLDKGVVIERVVTARMVDPVEQGQAHVYFFPQGHSEPAVIHLANDSGDAYSIVLHPLTGQARVYPCRYDIPESFGAGDDARGRGERGCERRGGI